MATSKKTNRAGAAKFETCDVFSGLDMPEEPAKKPVPQEVLLVRSVTNLFPPKEIHARVAEAVQAGMAKGADEAFLRRCWEEWVIAGWSRVNYGWLFDWFAEARITFGKRRDIVPEPKPDPSRPWYERELSETPQGRWIMRNPFSGMPPDDLPADYGLDSGPVADGLPDWLSGPGWLDTPEAQKLLEKFGTPGAWTQ